MTNKKVRDNGIGYISASREGMYSKCRYQFYDQVIVGKHDQYDDEYESDMDSPVYLLFGSAIHKTLEVFHKEHYTKKSDLKKLFRKNYIDFGVDDRDYYALGFDILENYFSYLKYKAPKRVLCGTEIFFRVCLGKDRYGNDVCAQGTIDAVWYLGNGIYEIVDYKTSNYLPSTDEFEANTQIALYDIAFHSKELSEYWYNGIEPKAVLLTMNYLRHENGVLQTECDDEEREFNRMYFIDTFTKMNTKRPEFFVPKISTLCPYCSSKDHCPKYQELIAGDSDYIKEIIADFSSDDFAENIRSIARYKGMIRVLDSEIANLQSECESYIKKHDEDVVIDDTLYFLGNSSRRYTLPVITMKILKKYGLWDEKEFVPNIPIGKLEKLCRNNPEAWDALERKAIRKSNGAATLKSKKVPKGQLFVEKHRMNKK